MKELSIEEKARCYDEAFEKAKKELVSCGNGRTKMLQRIFPELKQSEDERIRKAILKWLSNFNAYDKIFDSFEYEKINIIEWLEKQGEQKSAIFIPKFRVGDKFVSTKNPRLTYEVLEVGHINELGNPEYKVEIFTDGKGSNPRNIHDMECYKVDEWAKLIEKKPTDKVEPKFNVGEWVVSPNGVYWHIDKISNNRYEVTSNTGESSNWNLDTNIYHKFNIQDAKDGDVLATLDYILIFEKLLPKDGGVSYCHYDFGCSTPQFNFNKDDNWYFGKEAKVYPATKEQRDKLEKAMADAGWEFDFDKKELKKIEPTDKIGRKFKVGDIVQYITDSTYRRKIEEIGTLCNMYHTDSLPIMFEAEDEWEVVVNAEDVEQEPVLSEEDDSRLKEVLYYIEYINRTNVTFQQKNLTHLINWLKSLRPQTKQEWSQNDIDMIDWLIRCCEKEHEKLCNDKYGHQDIVSDLKRDCRKKWDWLESLKNRVAPQKQWKPSNEQMNALSVAVKHGQTDDPDALKKLLEQLKKLIEE